MMSDDLILGLVSNLPATLTAGAALLVAIRTLKVSKSTHVLSNSKLTNVQKQLAVALRRIGELEGMKATARKERRARPNG